MECFYDIENDYGLRLQCIGKSIGLENIRDPKREYYKIAEADGSVFNHEAYNYICNTTIGGFENEASYENYIKLFEIMGIQKLYSFKELMKERKVYVTELARVSGIPRTTISRIAICDTPFEKITVSNALAIAKAMNMTIEEIYDKLYFSRSKQFFIDIHCDKIKIEKVEEIYHEKNNLFSGNSYVADCMQQ